MDKRYPVASQPYLWRESPQQRSRRACAAPRHTRRAGTKQPPPPPPPEAGDRRGTGRPGRPRRARGRPHLFPGEGARHGTGRGRLGGRQTLRSLQAPPQNGGHLWQGLFSLPASNDRLGANPSPVLNYPPGPPGAAAALPSSSAGMRRTTRRDLEQNPPHLKWRPPRLTRLGRPPPPPPHHHHPATAALFPPTYAGPGGPGSAAPRLTSGPQRRACGTQLPHPRAGPSAPFRCRPAGPPLSPSPEPPGPLSFARRHSPLLAPNRNCAMRANKGAAGLYTADVTSRLESRMHAAGDAGRGRPQPAEAPRRPRGPARSPPPRGGSASPRLEGGEGSGPPEGLRDTEHSVRPGDGARTGRGWGREPVYGSAGRCCRLGKAGPPRAALPLCLPAPRPAWQRGARRSGRVTSLEAKSLTTGSVWLWGSVRAGG